MNGNPIPLQCQMMDSWSDGSIKWARVDTILHSRSYSDRVNLHIDGEKPLKIQNPVVVHVDGNSVVLSRMRIANRELFSVSMAGHTGFPEGSDVLVGMRRSRLAVVASCTGGGIRRHGTEKLF